MVCGMFVLYNFCFSVCMCMVSNALLMSSAVRSVLCGGFLLLKPCVMCCVMLVNAVTVEWCFLKPC